MGAPLRGESSDVTYRFGFRLGRRLRRADAGAQRAPRREDGPEMAYLSNLTLYFKPTCPFCLKVLAYMEQQDIACEMRDTRQPGVRDELVAIGGKGQVPCLVIDGEPLYESDDIIAYLHGLVAAGELG